MCCTGSGLLLLLLPLLHALTPAMPGSRDVCCVGLGLLLQLQLRALTSAMPRSRDDVDPQEQRPTDAVGLLLLG